ncbi:MAG: acetyltransferase [Hyphomonas sp.]|nr:acetyltransferase [Hyphomonas sp.]
MIHLLPVTQAQHRPRVAGWLAMGHVSRWWGDSSVGLAQFDDTPETHHALIARDNRPIGYVRWERVDLDDLASVGLMGIPEGSLDMDIFIGDPDALGCGPGSTALSLAFDRVFNRIDPPLIMLCTSAQNIAAQAAFEKSGCQRTAHFDDGPNGSCWLYARQSVVPTRVTTPSNAHHDNRDPLLLRPAASRHGY